VPESDELSEKDLGNWKLLKDFHEALARVFCFANVHPTFDDPRRKLAYGDYLSLFLFGLVNPVVKSMRGLCAASNLPRVQREICHHKVSLGSFSEVQAVLDPDLLHQTFCQLAERVKSTQPMDPRLAHLELIAQDGSLWRALPRMGWAEYGVGPDGKAKGVRLHLRFHLQDQAPVDARIGNGKSSEREALRKMSKAGQINVGDRLYGTDYKLLDELNQAQAYFVFRIKEGSAVQIEQELPLSEADRAANVVRQAWVRLGAVEQWRSIKVRLVQIRTATHDLLLVTNLPLEKVAAELVGAIYRRRWSIELFFRWIKCILQCRHFFAESREGVAIQMYLALIAALLFQLWTGRRPNKRTMELFQFFQMGWASADDLKRFLQKYAPVKKSA
jgi:Transposase DDE domain